MNKPNHFRRRPASCKAMLQRNWSVLNPDYFLRTGMPIRATKNTPGDLSKIYSSNELSSTGVRASLAGMRHVQRSDEEAALPKGPV